MTFGKSVWKFQFKKKKTLNYIFSPDVQVMLYIYVYSRVHSVQIAALLLDVELLDVFCFLAGLSCCMCQLMIQCKTGIMAV